MINNENDSLVKYASELFVGNENAAGFNVRDLVSPSMLVNGDLGFQQCWNLVSRDKGVLRNNVIE
jgi:hypothetical protein